MKTADYSESEITSVIRVATRSAITLLCGT